MSLEAISTITSKNQTTVPKVIRKTLALEPGDKIKFTIGKNGLISMTKAKESADDMWAKAYRQEKKYGSYDTAEPDWGLDIESEDID